MDFGFTNDMGKLEAANAYREKAVADGWDCSSTYGSEPVERASSLTKDGFVMIIISRDRREDTSKWNAEASISVWGPDRLGIKPPAEYDWKEIQAGTRICNECGTKDVDTHRFSFAGRACGKCLPAAQTTHEYPGWTR